MPNSRIFAPVNSAIRRLFRGYHMKRGRKNTKISGTTAVQLARVITDIVMEMEVALFDPERIELGLCDLFGLIGWIDGSHRDITSTENAFRLTDASAALRLDNYARIKARRVREALGGDDLESQLFIRALTLADGNDRLCAGIPLTDAAGYIAHDPSLAYLEGDVIRVRERIRYLFEDTRIWRGKQCYIAVDNEMARRKAYKLYLQDA